jgi:hypothetical protein
MGETHYTFNAEQFRWQTVFSKAMGAAGMDVGDVVTVGTVRGWIRNVTPRQGLRPELEDLVITAWAALQGRAWYRFGGVLSPVPKPGSLTDDIELRPEPVPSKPDWDNAVRRAAAIFGITANTFLTGTSVAELAHEVRINVGPQTAHTRQLVDQLTRAHERLAVATDGPGVNRLATARAASSLVADLAARRDNVALVEALARADLPSTEAAVGRSLKTAFDLAGRLVDYPWQRLTPLREAEKGTGDRSRDAKGILDQLRAALAADELSQPLSAVLKRAEDDAFNWALVRRRDDDSDKDEDSRKQTSARGRHVLRGPEDLDVAGRELAAFVDEHSNERIVVEWRVEP